MTEIHPKAAEAQSRAADRRKQRDTMKAELKIARNQGVRFARFGATTFAYHVDRKNVIHVANTVKHPNDHDDVLVAKFVAARRLLNNEHITLRLPTGDTFYKPKVEHFLSGLFYHLTRP